MRNQIILKEYILFNRAVHARATGHQEFSSRALVTIVPIMLLLLGPLFLILVCVGYRVFVKTKKAQAVKWVPYTAPYLPTNINEQFCKTIFLKSINVFFSRLTLIVDCEACRDVTHDSPAKALLTKSAMKNYNSSRTTKGRI